MKPKLLLIAALIAFFGGIGLLASAWNGTFTITGSSPISASSVQLCGGATGWRAVFGLAALVAAAILFVWGLISASASGVRRATRSRAQQV